MKRDTRIDFLRSLGILLIILAHVSPPLVLMELRMFDVPLMTFLMGMSMLISDNKNDVYISYVGKRFKRLILPMIVFLTLFFIFFNIINVFSEVKIQFSLRNYIGSYSTFSGIGYVWIIRVFFIMSILSPLFIYINTKIKTLYFKLGFILLMLIIQEVAVNFIQNKDSIFYVIISNLVIMSFGYAIVTQVGMWTYNQSRKENTIFILFMFILLILLLMKYPFFEKSNFKYPPFPIYLVYGMLVSTALWKIVSNEKMKRWLGKYKILVWLSVNSMSLYYWHIIPVYYFKNYASNSIITNNWVLFYIVVLLIVVLGTVVQNYLKKLKQNNSCSEIN